MLQKGNRLYLVDNTDLPFGINLPSGWYTFDGYDYGEEFIKLKEAPEHCYLMVRFLTERQYHDKEFTGKLLTEVCG